MQAVVFLMIHCCINSGNKLTIPKSVETEIIFSRELVVVHISQTPSTHYFVFE
jgi:hypothetical protein